MAPYIGFSSDLFVSSAKYIENRLVMDSMSAVYSKYVSGPAELVHVLLSNPQAIRADRTTKITNY